jgi:hypothetical protein
MYCRRCRIAWQTLPGEEQDHPCPYCGRMPWEVMDGDDDCEEDGGHACPRCGRGPWDCVEHEESEDDEADEP